MSTLSRLNEHDKTRYEVSNSFTTFVRVISALSGNYLKNEKYYTATIRWVLPIIQEITFDDIVIGAFPLDNNNLLSALHDSENSLDDLLNVIGQALKIIYVTF